MAGPTSIGLIWAQSADRCIGKDGDLPWHLPEDQAHFREITTGSTVIMGRRTWDSLPERFRPLPGRRNVVLSRQEGLELEGATVVPDVAQATACAAGNVAWVIGGEQVYRQLLPLADRVELTQIDVTVQGDTRAPTLDRGWRIVSRSPHEGWHTSRTGLRYRFLSFTRESGGDGIPQQRRTPPG